MGVSKKGKKKFIYNNITFYWYVTDGDLDDCYPLHIMSDDKTIQLRYGSEHYGLYVNQFPDQLPEKVVIVKRSDTLALGAYPFTLPLNNSGVTPFHIKLILDWYFNKLN